MTCPGRDTNSFKLGRKCGENMTIAERFGIKNRMIYRHDRLDAAIGDVLRLKWVWFPGPACTTASLLRRSRSDTPDVPEDESLDVCVALEAMNVGYAAR